MSDIGHKLDGWVLPEIEHQYGDNVHILNDPYYGSLLAKICSPNTQQPMFNHLIRKLYEGLCRAVINEEFPKLHLRVKTRMAATTEKAIVEGSFIDPNTQVVTVDLARAGILPSMICFDIISLW